MLDCETVAGCGVGGNDSFLAGDFSIGAVECAIIDISSRRINFGEFGDTGIGTGVAGVDSIDNKSKMLRDGDGNGCVSSLG